MADLQRLPDLDDILDPLGGFTDTIREIIQDLLADGIEALGETVEAIIASPLDALSSGFHTLTTTVLDVHSTISENISAGLSGVGAIVSGATSEIDAFFTSTLSGLEGFKESFLAKLDDGLDDSFRFLVGTANRLTDLVTDGYESGTNQIREVVEGIELAIGDALNADFESLRTTFAAPLLNLGSDILGVLDVVSDTAKDFLEWGNDALDSLGKNLLQQLPNYWGFTVKEDWGDLKDKLDPIIKMLEDDPDTPDEVRSALEPGFPLLGFLGVSLVGIVLGAAIGGSLSAMFSGPILKIQQTSMQKSRPTLLTPQEIDELVRRNPELESSLMLDMTKLGYSDVLVEARSNLRNTLLGVVDIIALWHRDEIEEIEADTRLSQLGYLSTEITAIKKLAFPIPPVNDLIRFAVREVFTPDIAAEFGIFEDFPAAFAEQADKHGLSAEWQRAYWGAHWALPSPQMGFEMLHRDVINSAQLDLLLRASDVMPFWRQKVVDIAFKTITRVDIRRMRKMDVFTRADVLRAYLHLGYDATNAELLTEFTERLVTEPDSVDDEAKALTRAQVLRFFSEKEFNEPETIQLLTDIGYDNDTARLFVGLEVMKADEHLVSMNIRTIRARFRSGELDFNGAVMAFDSLPIASERRDLLLAEFEVERIEAVRVPTRGDLDRFLKANLVTDEFYIQSMVNLGYSIIHAKLYLASIKEIEEITDLFPLGIDYIEDISDA